MTKKFPVIFSICLFIFLVSSSKTAFATILFEDNFDDGDVSEWTTIDTDGSGVYQNFTVSNGRYGMVVNFPNSIGESITGDISWTDYIYEFDLISFSGDDRNAIFRWQDQNHRLGIHLTGGKLYIEKLIPDEEKGGPENPTPMPFISISGKAPHGKLHHFKITLNGRNIKIDLNDEEIINFTDNNANAILSGKIGIRIGTGITTPSEVWFDNIVVRSLEEENEEREPIVFLPGLGGSWNHQEIFLGIDQPQSAWYKTPFTICYDSLIQTIQNAGYTLNENLFIFYYDWLQSIDQSAANLHDYINTVVDPPLGTKINLIGHSLGGLVSRTYIQSNPGSHRVNKLITLGSPHKGVVQVYKAWEGVDLHGLLGEKERIGAGILLRLRGFGYPNLVEAIQNLVPSLGNLLFIDDYLRWNNDESVKPETSMIQQNTWLKGLGISPELLELTNTVAGTSGDTPRWLNIIERNQIDEKLEKWEDGKPVDKDNAVGDETVLEESGKLENANIVTLDGLDHGELVTSSIGQEKILELLDINSTEIVEQTKIPFEPALVFTVASPATLQITDPLGRQIGTGVDLTDIPNATFSAQGKMMIIPEAINGKYNIKVISESGGGLYKLLIGQLTQNQDIWTLHQGTVKPGKQSEHIFAFDSSLKNTNLYLAELINLKLKNLLTQIRRGKFGLRVRATLSIKVLKIWGQTRPIPLIFRLGKDKMAMNFLQNAILKTTEAIDYAGEFSSESLPVLREILDLLSQLHQLLENKAG